MRTGSGEWALLEPLPAGDRAAVLAAARRRTYAKGEVVFREGDPGDCLHLVTSGHLAIWVATPDGERATLNIVGPGSHVGELSLVEDAVPHVRSATVVALDAVTTMSLTTAAFQALCASSPRVQGLLVALLAERVRELSGRLLDAMYVGLDRRLFRTLLQLTTLYGAGPAAPGADGVVVPLTQEQLADLVGGTRPTVNQVLRRLEDQGVIALGRGRVVVRDAARLRRKAGL